LAIDSRELNKTYAYFPATSGRARGHRPYKGDLYGQFPHACADL
jgi:hypothetical protein